MRTLPLILTATTFCATAALAAPVSFSVRIDRVFVYLRPMDAKKVGDVTLCVGGRRLPATRTDAPGLTLLESKLDPAWEPGSYHVVEARLSDGARAAQVVRARDNFFVVGLYGVAPIGYLPHTWG